MTNAIDGAARFLVGAFVLPLLLATSAPAQRITATWQGQQLAVVLDRLASIADRPIWLDRRVDPQRQVDAQLTDAQVDHALAELAAQQGLGAAELGGVMYIGPEQTANGLTALAGRARAAVRRAPAARQRAWSRTAPWQWLRLTEPRTLVADLARQANVTLEGAELVPHDLWPARQVPPLPLVDRMVLVLAGFDLTCEISPDGKTCRIVPIDFPLPTVQKAKLPRPAEAWPDGAAGKISLFTLRMANQPVGAVLDQLAEQLKLELAWDEASLAAKHISRDALVSCDVSNADLDGLLRAILEPAGMAFSREGHRVVIRAGDP